MSHRIVVLTALAVTLIAPRARAQGPTAVRTTDFGIALGAALPLGDRLRGPQQPTLESPERELDVAGGANAGFTIAASVGIRPANSLVSYRLEAQYSRFGLDPQGRYGPGGAPETADGHVSSLSGTGNVVLAVPIASRLRPYLTGGAGAYLLTSDITQEPNSTYGPRSSTRFGLNGGIGAEMSLGSRLAYVEARYHTAFTTGERANFLPITVGLRF